ncbi:MAG: HD domain-containing phosphohydrolase [bacterium]
MQIDNSGGGKSSKVTDAAKHPDVTNNQAWKIIIADDEPEVHTVTRLVLRDFSFKERPLLFLSAYSGEETQRLIEEHPDTALLLLDVVMETDHAGLEVVKYIRDTLKNTFVRIILRTGQPGQAPERKVISTYDINDYKDKTELTSDRLYTTVMASLRAYQDLLKIERNRKGLEQIVTQSPKMLGYLSFRRLAREVLEQLMALLSIGNGHSCGAKGAVFVMYNHKNLFCLKALGRFAGHETSFFTDAAFTTESDRIKLALEKGEQIFDQTSFAGVFKTSNDIIHVIYFECHRKLEAQDYELIRLLMATAAAAFENMQLSKEIEATHKEIVDTLGEMIESRFVETGNHVKRVAAYAQIIALKAGLSEKDAEILRFTAPMHDIGKIGIPDTVLKKPGTLTPEEYEIMKQHTTIGHNILKRSNRPILKAASIIALQHHERWDGKGYPNGLKGEDIHIFGRIIRLVDVFDALRAKRVYKKAWTTERIIDYMERERGKQFDPRLVDIFIENIDELLAVSGNDQEENNG